MFVLYVTERDFFITETPRWTLPIFIRVQLLSICWLACRKYRPSVHIAACCSVTMAVPEWQSMEEILFSTFFWLLGFICTKSISIHFSEATYKVYTSEMTAVNKQPEKEWILLVSCKTVVMSGQKARFPQCFLTFKKTKKNNTFLESSQPLMGKKTTFQHETRCTGVFCSALPLTNESEREISNIILSYQMFQIFLQWKCLITLTLECAMGIMHKQYKPAEPSNPEMNSRLQSHGAMYSLWKSQGHGRNQLH